MAQIFNQKILKWYNTQGRKNLPWQQNPTPYRVWVSEIMLQQTQVATVIPYYDRFMKRFPSITALAKASLDEVLHLWTGLGYYARARNLHRAASIIVDLHQGIFPNDFQAVLELPGIGRSTAGAILALSLEQRHPILDGNVKRVLTRYFGVTGYPGIPAIEQQLWALSESMLPKKNLRAYTQAMMDLGATLCTRTKPSCNACPVEIDCKARQSDQVHLLPTPKVGTQKPIKTVNLFIYYHIQKNCILLVKRATKGIWGGLYSFPENNILVSNILQSFLSFRHTFTHFHLDIEAYFCPVNSTQAKTVAHVCNNETFYWQSVSSPLEVGVAAPIKRIFKELQCHILSIA